MIETIVCSWEQLVGRVKRRIKQRTKLISTGLVAGTFPDAARSRTQLIAENAVLRQQLIVLRRQIKRPQMAQVDRIRLVLLARCTQFWQQALHIVQPDTLLRCHLDLFRRYRHHKSLIAPETNLDDKTTGRGVIDTRRQIDETLETWVFWICAMRLRRCFRKCDCLATRLTFCEGDLCIVDEELLDATNSEAMAGQGCW